MYFPNISYLFKMKVMKPYIYLIKNNINGLCYIGQHCGKSKTYMGSGKLILAAYDTYGKENFTKTIIEYCNKEDLDQRERYWISYYNTYEGLGYNKTPGGEKSDPDIFCRLPRTVKVLQYSKSGKFIKMWASQTEAAESLQISNTCISDCINHRQKTAGGFIWMKYDGISYNDIIDVDLTHKNKGKPKDTLKIRIKDLDTNMIFESIGDAAKYFGVHHETIRTAVHKPITKRSKRKLIIWQ